MLNPRVPGPSPGCDLTAIACQLAETGYVIAPAFLPRVIAEALVTEITTLWHDGAYRPAAVGRGEEKQVRGEIRNDHVRWLEPGDLTSAQAGYRDSMEELRIVLNRELFLGLFDFEAHLACFPAGANYKAHLDRHRESEARLVSAIVYLNPDWTAHDGGELRLYTDRETGVRGPFLDVVPVFGTLVLFFSADFWHEVLPSLRERHSITGWFRRRSD